MTACALLLLVHIVFDIFYGRYNLTLICTKHLFTVAHRYYLILQGSGNIFKLHIVRRWWRWESVAWTMTVCISAARKSR